MAPVLTAANAIALAGVVRPTVEKLDTESRSVRSVKNDLQYFSDKFSIIHSWIEKLEKVKSPSKEMLEWCKKATGLSYKVEHRIRQYVCERGKFSVKLWQSRIIKSMKKDLNSILDEYRSNKWDQVTTSDMFEGLISRPTSVLAQGNTALVGCQRQHDDLMSLLHWDPQAEGNSIRVISIKGPGGSGKTTLALSAMSSTTTPYDILATVGVSSSCSTTNLLMEIWRQVTQKELPPSMPHEDHLIPTICDFLVNKRYLILLDDVWNEEIWEFLKPAFPSNRLGSRIILTTRVQNFALSCPERNELVIRMLPLDYAASKALFLTTIYGENRCPEEFEGHLPAILKKCDGLPLPILKIATHILRYGPTQMKVWAKMSGEDNCFLESPEFPPLYVLHQILSLSYTLLPRHQKNCVLFLSGLPQGSIIDVDVAISSWIAEEFVCSRSAAQTCLNQLVSYHLVQVVQTSVIGDVLSIRVPKLIHDMLGKISYDKSFYAPPPHIISGPEEIRVNRLPAQVEFSASRNMIDKARALILHSSKAVPFEKCTYLRVLIVHMCNGFSNNDLKIVATLAYLKVLVLNTPGISDLPRQTRNLHRLEALVMQTLSSSLSRSLPTVSRFHSLTCLKVGVVALPAGIGMLKKLEKLEVFDVDGSQIEAVSELGQLHSLKVLSCYYSSQIDAADYMRHVFFVAAIKELLTEGNLEELIFTGESMKLQFISFFQIDASVLPSRPILRKFCMYSNIYISCFPAFLRSFSLLSDVSINLENLRPEDIEAFDNFHSLKQLKLWINSAPAVVEFTEGMFQELQRLALFSPVLDLRFKAGCLKKLDRLHLVTTNELHLCDLHEVSCLEKLYVSLINASAAAAADITRTAGEAVAKCRAQVKSHVVDESWRTASHPCFGEDVC